MARPHQGKFLGIPYNFSTPRRGELGRGVWDRGDERIITPKNDGWGWTINFAALGRRGRRRPPQQ